MAIFDFFLSRNRAAANVEAYLGHVGRLFYDSTDKVLRIGNGTPGGERITYPVATETTLGGIKAGPGANVSIDGTLTIDTAGLPLSFGDFTANVNMLTLVNADQDMILATQGNAEIQLVGNIGFYRTNGFPPDPNNLFFSAKSDGQIKILVPDEDPLLSAVEIIGSATGNSITPAQVGVMLHITGQPGTFASQYIDGINNFPNYIGRRYNGNVGSPTQVMSGNTIVRFSGQGYSTGGFNAPADGTISLDALEDFTGSNQGAIWRFLVNPVGGNIRQQVANIAVATGVSATQFNTSGNVTAGNVVAGMGTFTSNVTAGNISTTQINTTGAIVSADGIYDSLGLLRGIPQNSKNTGYTLQSTDNGQMINITSGNVTIPAGVFNSPFGQTISIYNNQNSSNAIVQGSGVTMRLAGTAATGNRTIARYGVATVICVAANTFVISGAGIT
jgi:hypothetical protein